MYRRYAGINSSKRNIYDYLIIITIISVIFTGEVFGAFTPIRLIGFLSAIFFLFSTYGCSFLLRKDLKIITSFFSLMIFHIVLSALWIVDLKSYFIAALSVCSSIFVFLLIVYSASKAKDAINSIMLGWVVFLIINLLCAFWEISTGEHFSAGNTQADNMIMDVYGLQSYRMYAAVTYGNFNSFSIVLCMCLLFLLLYFYICNVKMQIILLLLFYLICIVLVVNTSRGSLVCLCTSFVPLWYILRKTKTKYFLLILLLGLGICLWREYSDMIMFLIERKIN